MNSRMTLYTSLLCALFAAITALCSQIMIPLPFTPVPINLTLLAVWICGGVLGAKRGVIAILVYILLGAIGVPVFHGLQGGLGVLAGPTGGYIAGFVPAVVVFALFHQSFASRTKKADWQPDRPARRFVLFTVIGLPALAVCYAFGTAWFILSTGTGFLSAMMMCVIPFIPGDVLKLIASAAVLEALRKPLSTLRASLGPQQADSRNK